MNAEPSIAAPPRVDSRRWRLWAIVAGLALVLFAWPAIQNHRRTASAIEEVKKSLKDPFTAQFRNVEIIDDLVCGQVNARNSFGAYVGWEHFAVYFAPDDRASVYQGEHAARSCQDARLPRIAPFR